MIGGGFWNNNDQPIFCELAMERSINIDNSSILIHGYYILDNRKVVQTVIMVIELLLNSRSTQQQSLLLAITSH